MSAGFRCEGTWRHCSRYDRECISLSLLVTKVWKRQVLWRMYCKTTVASAHEITCSKSYSSSVDIKAHNFAATVAAVSSSHRNNWKNFVNQIVFCRTWLEKLLTPLDHECFDSNWNCMNVLDQIPGKEQMLRPSLTEHGCHMRIAAAAIAIEKESKAAITTRTEFQLVKHFFRWVSNGVHQSSPECTHCSSRESSIPNFD